MQLDDLQALKRKEPFEPFCIRTVDSGDYDVHECCDFMVAGQTVVVVAANGHFRHLSLNHIQSVELIDPSHTRRERTRQCLKTLLRAAPFQPFTVYFTGGETLNVEWPEDAMLTISGLYVARGESVIRYAMTRIESAVLKEQTS